ncbi:DUF3055 family protein [Paenalkalicoccus suaedae]|uniref:DUF3055 family protein n=1 Tax=Paenalkalicoccus suaedae TaxID=2592382 RepID=A0A859FFE1_9BACI|nr:SAV0927 family protein [Paenalkalicoccus suaedae]QKS71570.1 DUF3055 family protein [Paenalkalicoccus suaedae]
MTSKALYNELEQVDVQFVGVEISGERHDYCMVYTSFFFGKVLMFCMRTGKQILLSSDCLFDVDNMKKMFQIEDEEDINHLILFLKDVMRKREDSQQGVR